MNIKTVALTKEQYQTIIQTMKQGFTGCRPNERIATALTLEANLGLRIHPKRYGLVAMSQLL